MFGLRICILYNVCYTQQVSFCYIRRITNLINNAVIFYYHTILTWLRNDNEQRLGTCTKMKSNQNE